MNTWNAIAQVGALLVLVRMVCFGNMMRLRRVPQRCVLGVLCMAVAGLAVLCAPIYGMVFTWPQALFIAAAAVYVWADRRVPITRGPQ